MSEIPHPAATGTPPRGRPEPIKAIPVRHPWRWVSIAVIAVLVAMFEHVLLTNPAFDWRFMFGNMFTAPVLRGVRGTIIITVLSMVLGVVLGVLVAVARLSENPVLSSVSWVYTWFFRAVPRLVLLAILGNLGILWARMELGMPFDRQIADFLGVNLNMRFWGIPTRDLLSGFMVAVLGLGLSEAAYMAEIVRAGMQAVDPGQHEAATALGMSHAKALRRIVLPQAMRVIIPPTGNETIAMLKDTSLLIVVPVTGELFFQLDSIGKRTFNIFPMYVAASLWYLFLVSLLLVGQHFLERHFAKGYGRGGQGRRPGRHSAVLAAKEAKVRLDGLPSEQGGRVT
jgi:polar amino acid transport system permease protein